MYLVILMEFENSFKKGNDCKPLNSTLPVNIGNTTSENIDFGV
jgi:hypothetical protein